MLRCTQGDGVLAKRGEAMRWHRFGAGGASRRVEQGWAFPGADHRLYREEGQFGFLEVLRATTARERSTSPLPRRRHVVM